MEGNSKKIVFNAKIEEEETFLGGNGKSNRVPKKEEVTRIKIGQLLKTYIIIMNMNMDIDLKMLIIMYR